MKNEELSNKIDELATQITKISCITNALSRASQYAEDIDSIEWQKKWGQEMTLSLSLVAEYADQTSNKAYDLSFYASNEESKA